MTHFIANNSSKYAHLNKVQDISDTQINNIVSVFNSNWGTIISPISAQMTRTQLMQHIQDAFYYELDSQHFDLDKSHKIGHPNVGLFDSSSTAHANYELFRYQFDNNYASKIIYLVRMALVLKDISPNLIVTSNQHQDDLDEALSDLRDNLGIDSTSGFSNYQAEILFSLFEIKKNANQQAPDQFCLFAGYINHFRANEWQAVTNIQDAIKRTEYYKNSKQPFKDQVAQINENNYQDGVLAIRDGLLPLSGVSYQAGKQDLHDEFTIALLNGTLARYMACQGLYPRDLVHQELGVRFPVCTAGATGYQSYFDNSLYYARDLLRDALYIRGYENIYDGNNIYDCMNDFIKKNDLKTSTTDHIDDAYIRALFDIKWPKETKFAFKNTILMPTSSKINTGAMQAAYLNQESKQLLFDRYDSHQNSNSVYCINFNSSQTQIDYNQNNLVATIESNLGGHTQTLTLIKQPDQFLIGIDGKQTTLSSIKWAQNIGQFEFSNTNNVSSTKISDYQNKLVTANLTKLNITRVEAATNSTLDQLVIFIKTSDDCLLVYRYDLQNIINKLEQLHIVDLAKIDPLNQYKIEHFSQIVKSLQGFAFDQNGIYISSQFAPQTDPNQKVIDFANWPRQIVFLPWQHLEASYAQKLNLVSNLFKAPNLDNRQQTVATELEGLQILNNGQILIPYVEHGLNVTSEYNDMLNIAIIQPENWPEL